MRMLMKNYRNFKRNILIFRSKISEVTYFCNLPYLAFRGTIFSVQELGVLAISFQ